ncbi:MAG: patatin-like phospholipase family protein, partial [Bacteroidia bacterium]|nr:patatin-like phospholipase family protein [Bacteroidia bacterium]
HGPETLPKFVILCVTGGGTRSAVWTVQTLQEMERRTNGKFFDQVGVICGASGGMMGAAFYRDLVFRKQNGENEINLYDTAHVEAISKDLLNAPIFSLSTNFITPRPKLIDAGCEYRQDRGYVFDRRFESMTGMENRRLGDYAQAERRGQIPLLLLSTAIVNDARLMLVSPQNLSFLTQPAHFNEAYENEIAVVEFRRLFANRQPDSLRFSTALRLNATFPTILPFVEMPTEPMIEVMDAGAIDNYGVNMAVKYLNAMQDWLKRNTSGVILIQIRDHMRVAPIVARKKDLISKTLGILGGTYNTLIESKDFFNDQLMEYAKAMYPAPFDVVEIEYIPGKQFREATLSFRLTQREKQDVADAIFRPENQRAFGVLERLLQ